MFCELEVIARAWESQHHTVVASVVLEPVQLVETEAFPRRAPRV
jgi:hypothetical protein